jgi:hypothetical protein
MHPEDLAARHPRIYHVTEPGAWSNIKKNGLLSTFHILNLFGVDNKTREIIEEKPRSVSITLNHQLYAIYNSWNAKLDA